MAIGGNRPTMSIRSHEEPGRPVQNKENATHYHLETVQQSMEEPATGSKRNGHFTREDACPGS
jgi:hypothetical protein